MSQRSMSQSNMMTLICVNLIICDVEISCNVTSDYSLIGDLCKCNLTHQSNCSHMQAKKTPLSMEVPMGFVLISLHPYDYIHHNWF